MEVTISMHRVLNHKLPRAIRLQAVHNRADSSTITSAMVYLEVEMRWIQAAIIMQVQLAIQLFTPEA